MPVGAGQMELCAMPVVLHVGAMLRACPDWVSRSCLPGTSGQQLLSASVIGTAATAVADGWPRMCWVFKLLPLICSWMARDE